MKDPRVFVNPLRILSLRLDREATRLDDRRTAPRQISLEESLITTADKIIDIIRLISKCIVTGEKSEMDRCAALAEDVHQQEKMLTKNLLSSGLRGELFKGLVRFPSRLERIGDTLETILKCCRIKAREGISFSDKAEEELDQLFAMLLEMMNNVRDAFKDPQQASSGVHNLSGKAADWDAGGFSFGSLGKDGSRFLFPPSIFRFSGSAGFHEIDE